MPGNNIANISYETIGDLITGGDDIFSTLDVEEKEREKELLIAITLSNTYYGLANSNEKSLNSHTNKDEKPFFAFFQKQFREKEIKDIFNDDDYYKNLQQIREDNSTTFKKDEEGKIFVETQLKADKTREQGTGYIKTFVEKLKDAARGKNLAQNLTRFAISNAMLDCRDPKDSEGAGVTSKATVKYKITDNGRDANGEVIGQQKQAQQTDHNSSYANIEAYVNKASQYNNGDLKDKILGKVKSFTELFHDREGKLTAQGHAFNLIITLIAAKNGGLSSQPGELQKDIEELLKKKEVKEALGVNESDSRDEATIFALKEIACETSVRFKEIIERVKFINPPEDGYSKSADNPDRLCYNAILILKSQKEEIEKLDTSKVNDLKDLLTYLKGDSSCLNISYKLKDQLEKIIITPPPAPPPPAPSPGSKDKRHSSYDGLDIKSPPASSPPSTNPRDAAAEHSFVIDLTRGEP